MKWPQSHCSPHCQAKPVISSDKTPGSSKRHPGHDRCGFMWFHHPQDPSASPSGFTIHPHDRGSAWVGVLGMVPWAAWAGKVPCASESRVLRTAPSAAGLDVLSFMCIYIYIYLFMCVCVYLFIYLFIYIFIYLYIYIYNYIYILHIPYIHVDRVRSGQR